MVTVKLRIKLHVRDSLSMDLCMSGYIRLLLILCYFKCNQSVCSNRALLIKQVTLSMSSYTGAHV